MEKLFSDNDNLYRLLVEGVRDYAIFALDVDGTVLSWTPAAQDTKGYGELEIIGRHFSIFYSPEDIAHETPWRLLGIVRQTGQVEDEGWRIRKDGTRFWASVAITALYDNMGDLVGFGKVVRDLTQRRKAEIQALLDARRSAADESQTQHAEVQIRELSNFLTPRHNQLLELE